VELFQFHASADGRHPAGDDSLPAAEMQHNPNSAVNTFRSALGMNQIGTMTSKVTMYANRYNWEKALLLFGAMPGYGAQVPR